MLWHIGKRRTHNKSISAWHKNAKNDGVEKQKWTNREGVEVSMVRGSEKGRSRKEVGRNNSTEIWES